MKAAFAQVLAEETSALATVTDAGGLGRWRERLVERVTSANSDHCATVLRSGGDAEERTAFLERWRDLIAATVARIVNSDPSICAEIDARQTAISVLAALYGGAILSRVAKDAGPLDVSISLALAPLSAQMETAMSRVEN